MPHMSRYLFLKDENLQYQPHCTTPFYQSIGACVCGAATSSDGRGGGETTAGFHQKVAARTGWGHSFIHTIHTGRVLTHSTLTLEYPLQRESIPPPIPVVGINSSSAGDLSQWPLNSPPRNAACPPKNHHLGAITTTRSHPTLTIPIHRRPGSHGLRRPTLHPPPSQASVSQAPRHGGLVTLRRQKVQGRSAMEASIPHEQRNRRHGGAGVQGQRIQRLRRGFLGPRCRCSRRDWCAALCPFPLAPLAQN